MKAIAFLMGLLMVGCTVRINCPDAGLDAAVFEAPDASVPAPAILWDCDCAQHCADRMIDTAVCSDLSYIEVVSEVNDRCITSKSYKTTCICKTDNMVCKP